MSKPVKSMIDALEIVLDLAYQNALDADDYENEPDLFDEAKRQEKALGIVQRSLDARKNRRHRKRNTH